jgi:hypothetical protein
MVIRGIERKAIFKGDTDRVDFIERLSNLLREMDADAIGRYRSVRGHGRFVPLSCYRREGAGPPFKVDRSAISRANQRISRNPELPAVAKTMQRGLEFEINQH